MLGCGHISYIVKVHYSFKNLFLYSQAYFRQIMYIVMMTKEGFTCTKIITFMTSGVAVLLLGCGHMSYTENALFL